MTLALCTALASQGGFKDSKYPQNEASKSAKSSGLPHSNVISAPFAAGVPFRLGGRQGFLLLAAMAGGHDDPLPPQLPYAPFPPSPSPCQAVGQSVSDGFPDGVAARV